MGEKRDDLDIPNVQSLRSQRMRHRFLDPSNPPALTNYRGEAQSANDLTGIRNVHFPPLSQGEINIAPLGSNGSLVTGLFYLDGEYIAAKNEPVEYAWQPDRIERRMSFAGLDMLSVTILPFDCQIVLVRLSVHNPGIHRIRKELRFAVSGGVTRQVSPWNEALAPGEFDNNRAVDSSRGRIVFKSMHTEAVSVQGVSPSPDRIDPFWLTFDLDLAPGDTKTVTYVDSLATNMEDALRSYDAACDQFDTLSVETRDRWNGELQAAFTPGNASFSGCLPVLRTQDPDLRRMYHMTACTALLFRRTTENSVYGPVYVTLLPRYWVTTTVLWDISLSSTCLSLLDPVVLKKMMEQWMSGGVHGHFGTEYLTGASIGASYSVNDFAMCRMARDYLRWTGDRKWLDVSLAGRTVFDRLLGYASAWRGRDLNGHGLADYGSAVNLLEAVNNYQHEVAGMNAANVFNLRFAAELLELRGEGARASLFRQEASALLSKIMELYVEGEGVWRCRLPDGSTSLARHCYDFCTLLTTIPLDLSDAQKRDMTGFFLRELRTTTWMRALSLRDHDVTFSIRPDHQWTGSYPSWPALALSGLFRAGAHAEAAEWLLGLSRTMRQGPLGQAHFAEDVFPPEPGGGALKVPSDQPYINDWAAIASLAFMEPIIEDLFGIAATLSGPLRAEPAVSLIDPGAQLIGLRYQGSRYDITQRGITISGLDPKATVT